jgi:hypothetical protein
MKSAEQTGKLGGFGYARPSFSRAWYIDGGVSNGRIDVSITPGFVNGYQPTISGVPIGGGGRLPPRLRGAAQFDTYGRCYISVCVTVDVTSGLMKVPPGQDDITMAITNIRNGGENIQPTWLGKWYHPVAVVHHKGFIERVCYFDLLHWTSFAGGAQVGAKKYPDHFFSIV